MSGSHEKLPNFFWVQLIAAAFIGILWLFAPSDHSGEETKVDTAMVDALKPIGTVVLAKPVELAGEPRSGASIVDKNCKVCHSIGLANAPKLDVAAKADWEARMAGDLNALVASAIKGKGAMPARGGDSTLTDGEIESAILNMLSTVGVEVAEASKAKSAEAATTEKVVEASEVKTAEVAKAERVVETEKTEQVALVEKPAAVVTKSSSIIKAETATETEVVVAKKTDAKPVAIIATKLGESTYKNSCFACHDSGVAGSPKFADKAAWETRLLAGLSALHSAAINGKAAMPAKGGNPSLSDQAVIEAVNYLVVNSQ